jgi:hypothetical protein
VATATEERRPQQFRTVNLFVIALGRVLEALPSDAEDRLMTLPVWLCPVDPIFDTGRGTARSSR